MIITNPFTGMTLNADHVPNPEGCNQHTGPNCKGPSEMSKEEFSETFGIHSTDDPESFSPEDRLLEVTRPGKKRFFNSPIVVVRDKRGRAISGESFAAALDGPNAEVVTRDQEEAEDYERGYEAVIERLRKKLEG
jgi:hypothetical protein